MQLILENFKPANKGFPTIEMKEGNDNVLCSCVLISSPHTQSQSTGVLCI